VNLSHDEIILLTLGKNLSGGWDRYHVQGWVANERKAGREPPAYLDRPLFKHPPLLAMALSWIGQPGIRGMQNAFFLMFCFGFLTCGAVYGLARCLLPPMWSLLAAALAWVDPVMWAGSIKVWLDLPLTLFCTAALAFAWRGRTPAFCMGLCITVVDAPAMVCLEPARVRLVRSEFRRVTASVARDRIESGDADGRRAGRGNFALDDPGNEERIGIHSC
jgi:hypothetical protein